MITVLDISSHMLIYLYQMIIFQEDYMLLEASFNFSKNYFLHLIWCENVINPFTPIETF